MLYIHTHILGVLMAAVLTQTLVCVKISDSNKGFFGDIGHSGDTVFTLKSTTIMGL